jgi:Rps23 Pro-64 3,4-dihydroxylase Tpa1-like proline 4-hydroxylase
MLQPSNSVRPLHHSKLAKSLKVVLLLRGGQQFTVPLQSDDPLLRKLFQILIHRSQGKTEPLLGLLQIPGEGGNSSLYVPASEIVGLVAEPPMNLMLPEVWGESGLEQQLERSGNGATANQSAHELVTNGKARSPEPIAQFVVPSAGQSSPVTQLPCRYLQIDQFLSAADHDRALQAALTQEAKFVTSSTTTNANDYRQSAILYATHYEALYHHLRSKLLETLPLAVNHLNLPLFDVTEVEMQMTAHNDGCFYKIHNDSGDKLTATRILTYVYYFYQTPKAFSGGELRLYNTDLAGTHQTAHSQFEDIEPRNNSIVFFDSRCMHEVRTIHCPSRRFTDGRFTLNGWLRCPA